MLQKRMFFFTNRMQKYKKTNIFSLIPYVDDHFFY